MGSLSRFNLRKIIRAYLVPNMFETGTFWGDGVAYGLKSGFEKIVSVEIIPEIATKAKERFNTEAKVEIIETDSISALKTKLPLLQGNTLFWLDAHFPGADAGLAPYNAKNNEMLRLPLQKELEVISKLRAGFNDVFIIDDLRIYEDGPYENGNAPTEALPHQSRNIDFINGLFSKTHLILRFYIDEGYVLLLPKSSFNRNHFTPADLFLGNSFFTHGYRDDETAAKWNTALKNDAGKRRSELCKAKDFSTDWHERWCNAFKETPKMHRRQWEYSYILQALWERGCIAENQRGLVFSVGNEPLPAVLASYNCSILATDTAQEHEPGGKDFLNPNGICDPAAFDERLNYQTLPANEIPDDLKDFNFNWSSRSLQRIGSLEKGRAFLKDQLKTLIPGGWAIHITEYNIASNDDTIDDGNTLVYRQRDIDSIVAELRNEGHFVEELDYSLGGLEEDFKVDLYPHRQEPHIKLQVDKFVVTSIGLIIQKKY